jgi:hypothetical protein
MHGLPRSIRSRISIIHRNKNGADKDDTETVEDFEVVRDISDNSAVDRDVVQIVFPMTQQSG